MWVDPSGRFEHPWPGLLVRWRQDAVTGEWSGWVIWVWQVDGEVEVGQQWLRAAAMKPVASDPPNEAARRSVTT